MPFDSAQARDFALVQAGEQEPGKGNFHALSLAGGKLFIHESVWQSDKIQAQVALYDALARRDLSTNTEPPITTFEERVMREARIPTAPNPHRTLVALNDVATEERGVRIHVYVWSRGAVATTAVKILAAPKLVVPSASSTPGSSPWVQFPTTYGFTVFGPATARPTPDQEFQLRVAAIRAIEQHLEAFAARRESARAALDVAAGGLNAPSLVSKSFASLAPAVRSRIQAAQGAGGKALGPDATVSSVTSRLYIQERSARGDIIDIEVP